MSYIIAVADNSRAVVKCDGLVYEDSTGKLKTTEHESMEKLNPDCIVGFYGRYDLCKSILEEYKSLAADAKADINQLKPTTIIYDLNQLSKAMNENNETISFFVTGKENDKIILAGFTSTEEYEIRNFSPEEGSSVKFINFGSEVQGNSLPFTKFYRANLSFESCMNGYIRYLSQMDPCVNDNIFTQKVKI